MRTVTFLTAFYGAATLGVPSGGDMLIAQQDPILGTWSLNVEESDDPQEVMQRMRGGGGQLGGGRGAAGGRGAGGRSGRSGRGGGGRGGGGRGGLGGGRDQGGLGPGGGPMALVMRPVDRLTIEMIESNFNIIVDNRPTLLLYTDREKWTETIDGQGEVEFKVKYNDGKLEVERKFKASGMKFKEIYRLDEGEDRLEVTARLSGGRLPRRIQIKRVYDRVEMR